MTKNFTFLFLCATLLSCTVEKSSIDTPRVEEVFTIVMIPDTQNAVDFTHQKAEGFAFDASEMFIRQMEHIASKSISNGGDVAFVASVGDVWQHVTGNMDPDYLARGLVAVEDHNMGFGSMIAPQATLMFEIPKSIEGYQRISEAGIPFGVAPGNHDYDAWWAASPPNTPTDEMANSARVQVGGLNNFRMAFGSDTDFFRNKSWYVDSYNGGGSSAQLFSAGGYQFLHFAFEMQAGDEVLAWAQEVMTEYSGLPTIISTHDYLNPSGERLPSGSINLALVDPEKHNSAEDIWQNFISKNDQILMVLSGHQRGQALRIDTNEAGNSVYQILADYQDRGQAGIDAGQPLSAFGRPVGIGDGWYREMVFHLGGSDPRIVVQTYSSHYQIYSRQLDTYAKWYREFEQPDMSDMEFYAADEFTITLDDFYSRFGEPVNR